MKTMKTLWILKWDDPTLVAGLWPELKGYEVVVSGEFFAVVAAESGTNLEAALRGYPVKLAGHPADGRWLDQNGKEVYILNGEVVPSREALWEGLGLKPLDFDAETWDEADEDLVWSQVKTF